MKIPLNSPSAGLLRLHGVADDRIKATRIFVFNRQKGGAITLPLPFLGPTILIKSHWLVRGPDGELEDCDSLELLCHELCHVRQIQEWGAFAYLRRQLLARIKTRSVFAKSAPEEAECYEIQQRVHQRYHEA
ncbi:MAG: hypothetical protein C1O27_001461 [Chloroflexi bacterium]|jgi:hypothetical protein|nr:MAG: hypothetical protein C1O27_001461 [Chloroflexota bacterium]